MKNIIYKFIIMSFIFLSPLYCNVNNHIYKPMYANYLSFTIPNDYSYTINKQKLIIKTDTLIVKIEKTLRASNISRFSNKILDTLVQQIYLTNKNTFKEKNPKIKHFKNIISSYVELTDMSRINKPIIKDDWLYFTFGYIAKDDTFFSFYILTNKKSKEYQSIIQMFNNATYIESNYLKKKLNQLKNTNNITMYRSE